MTYTDIFFQAFIYLLATVITVPIATKIGLGSVLGYLIAGIIIGPHVLQLVGDHHESVMHIAEFGVVMMLFLIGLELRPAMLWQLRKSLLLTGGLQVIVTIAVIALIAKLFGLDNAASLAIGMILTTSSTAIVLQMLNEKGWIKLEAGSNIFAILLFQDIAIIPMLAIFPLLSNHVSTTPSTLSGWEQTVLIILLISTVIFSGKYLIRPVFRFIASSKLKEAFTALALLLVIGIALAMQYVGLSPALGAFLAGVVLAESEYRHELEADIDPFKGLLLGLFFISVGSNINFTLVIQHLTLILGIVVLLIITKFSVLFTLGRLFNKPLRDNLMISMTLAQSGEFCFVLLAYAAQERILPENLARELVAVIALSMLLTPLIILFYEKIIEPRSSSPKSVGKSDITQQDNPIIIAGFGRFGQVVGRFMLANGIGTTVLDTDANQIEILRKFGFKVFYGDATRMDVLETAGLNNAKILVLALDKTETILKVAAIAHQAYPHLKILIRVRNRTHVYDALQQQIPFDYIHSEVFESALFMASTALQELGVDAEKTISAATKFRKIDKKQLLKMSSLYNGKIGEDYISQTRLHNEELENILIADQKIAKLKD